MDSERNVLNATGKIKYRVYRNHPDIEYIDEPDKVFTYTDTFSFNEFFSKDSVREIIENDLRLVANGGYATSGFADIISLEITFN